MVIHPSRAEAPANVQALEVLTVANMRFGLHAECLRVRLWGHLVPLLHYHVVRMSATSWKSPSQLNLRLYQVDQLTTPNPLLNLPLVSWMASPPLPHEPSVSTTNSPRRADARPESPTTRMTTTQGRRFLASAVHWRTFRMRLTAHAGHLCYPSTNSQKHGFR